MSLFLNLMHKVFELYKWKEFQIPKDSRILDFKFGLQVNDKIDFIDLPIFHGKGK